VIGVTLGTLAAVRRDRFIDHLVMVLGNIGNVVPPFVLGRCWCGSSRSC
jgi:ABC-type dipeptide/oligopeptide/nickel transport systems, permease components